MCCHRGKGLVVVRRDDNTWSNPAFITLTGGSIGWQIGAQSSDIILVFKTRRGVDGISRGKMTLGVDASIAAGPSAGTRKSPPISNSRRKFIPIRAVAAYLRASRWKAQA